MPVRENPAQVGPAPPAPATARHATHSPPPVPAVPGMPPITERYHTRPVLGSAPFADGDRATDQGVGG